MTRVCSGCGLRTCAGDCYSRCPADYPPEVKAAPERKPYTPSPEYLAWLASLEPDCGPDPLRHLEPRKAA